MKLTRTEMKILIYKLMRNNSLSYDEAYKRVSKDIKHLEKVTKDLKTKRIKEKKDSKKKNKRFKEGLRKLSEIK